MEDCETLSDVRCLYATFETLTETQFREYMYNTINAIEDLFLERNPDYKKDPRCFTNLPIKYNTGTHMGFGYLWIPNPDVARYFVGRYEDGEEHFILPEIDGCKPCFSVHEIERVNVNEFDEGVIFCKSNVPKKYSLKKLVSIFTPFISEDCVVTAKRTANDKIFVFFSIKEDAYFALLMRRKYFDETSKLSFCFAEARAR